MCFPRGSVVGFTKTLTARSFRFLTIGLTLSAAISTELTARQAEQILQIDLTSQAHDTVFIEAGVRYRIVARYALPGKLYTLSYVTTRQSLDPLPDISRTTPRSACPIVSAYNDLRVASSEGEVKRSVSRIENELAFRSASCGEPDLTRGRSAVERTQREWWVGPYDLGVSVTLTVQRSGVMEGDPRAWNRTLTTPAAGAWRTTYGWAFLWQRWSRPEQYYARDSADVFVVTNESKTNQVTHAPMVSFTWSSAETAGRQWTWDKLISGLGINSFSADIPFVFLGSGFTFYEALSLHLGVAAHEVQRLKERYEAGSVLKENLDADQLHKGEVGFNPFISISFRFGRNPFSQQPKDKKVEGLEIGGA